VVRTAGAFGTPTVPFDGNLAFAGKAGLRIDSYGLILRQMAMGRNLLTLRCIHPETAEAPITLEKVEIPEPTGRAPLTVHSACEVLNGVAAKS
jgi:hypothetical protein